MPALAAVLLALAALVLAPSPAARAEGGLRIDVPVVLKEANVVFVLDHLAFEGDEPTGLFFMRIMVERFKAAGTKARIVAIFHGAAGYMALADATYDRERNWSGGNPYRDQIAALIRDGVAFEECGETMKLRGWTNADLIPGIKVNTGANFRVIELVGQGFVAIQP